MTSRARDYVESSGRCSSAASFPKGAEGVINQRDLDPHPERFLAGVVRSGVDVTLELITRSRATDVRAHL
jgi:hypothetical protein